MTTQATDPTPIPIDDTSSSIHTSPSSPSFCFIYENGRRYASHGSESHPHSISYQPHDNLEEARLDLVHHLWGLLLKGELHRVKLEGADERGPEEMPFRVLDLGTGTGLWAADFGEAWGNTEVTGVDLMPVEMDWVPPNVKFVVENFEEEWSFRHKFDYIHCRNLVGSISDYPGLMARIYENLVPGGLVEFQESHVTGCYSEDTTLVPSSPINAYSRFLIEAGQALSQSMDAAPNLASYLGAAGFIEIDEYKGKCAVGTWPKGKMQKELGRVCQEIMQTGVEAYGLAAFTRVLGWEGEKARQFCESVVKEFNNRKVHKIFPVYVVSGRKPREEVLAGGITGKIRVMEI